MSGGNVKIVDKTRKPRGVFKLRMYRHVNGKRRLIEVFEDKNLIVDLARITMAHLVAGEVTHEVSGVVKGRHITTMGFGTDGTEPEEPDTMLTDAFTKALDGFEYPVDGRVQFNWSLGTGEANGKAIREFGLFCADGSLFARRVREMPINKEDDISLEGTWTIIF